MILRQRSEHRRSKSAFKVEAFRAIIFQSQHSEHRRSESAFRAYDDKGFVYHILLHGRLYTFRVSIKSIDVHSQHL